MPLSTPKLLPHINEGADDPDDWVTTTARKLLPTWATGEAAETPATSSGVDKDVTA